MKAPSMRASASLLVLVAPLLTLLFADETQAQTHLERPTPLPAYGRSVVGNGDSTAMVQNPANLAFLPGPEVRWTGAFLDEDATSTSQGHALAFAMPLGFLPIATGLRFDMINPTSQASQDTLARNYNYQWLTWATAIGSKTASLGFAYQISYSDAAEYHHFGSWNLGLNLRPSDYFGLAGVIYNINSPTSDAGNSMAVTYEVATAVRPTGTDALEIGLEGAYVDEGYWVPRAVLDVGIPTLGRLRTDVSWIDPFSSGGQKTWVASTNLVVTGNTRSGSGELSIGSRYGNGLSDSASGDGNKPYLNLQAEVAFRGFRETHAADNTPYALRVRLESTPDAREHVALLRKLWSYADNEPKLRAVLLELRAAPADSLAHIQELQDAIYHLQDQGKVVLCSLESASGSALYLCSSANKTLINPAGGIRYNGLASSSYYLKDLLTTLGVRADFVRIGAHKSAPEALGRNEGSATAIGDRADLLQQVEMEISGSISRERKLSMDEFRAAVEKGPFTALEAKEAGLVDGFAFDDMLEEKTEELAQHSLIFEKGPRATTRDERFGPSKRLAIVYVDGDMVDGRSQYFPFVGIHTAGSYTIADSLKKVRDDPSVGAVVLRIETGGGSAMAADVLWREVQLTAKEKPVVVSMGTAAASGGYYIASPGSYIYANPLSITGSIGIFYGKLDVAGLLGKIGVNVETLRTSAHADAEAPFRPFSDEERETLKRKIEQFYGLFLRRVADGRGMTRKDVDAVGQGRVWTGRQAKEHKLVDALGGLRQALAKARVMGGLRDDVPIIELPVRKTTIVGKLLGMEGVKQHLKAQKAPLPPQLMEAAQAIAPYALYPADQPLSRVEVMPHFLP